MEGVPVPLAIHVRIRKENLGRTAFDDNVHDVRLVQLVERLRGENHGGILLSPSLESLDDVIANRRMAEEAPGFINEKRFERSSCVRVIDRCIGPMQDVKQQRLN